MVEHFSTVDKFHHKVKIVIVLESELEFHDEGMIEFFEDLSFNFDTGNLICLNDEFFAHSFHGINFACLIVNHLVHFAEWAATNDLHHSEVFFPNSVLSCQIVDYITNLAWLECLRCLEEAIEFKGARWIQSNNSQILSW